MKIKKIMATVLAAVLCVAGSSISVSAVEPRYEHEYVCTNTEEMVTEVVGTASVCFIRKWYCKHYCDLDGCPSYIYGELRYELIQYAHSYIGRYCSSCGYKNPISGN